MYFHFPFIRSRSKPSIWRKTIEYIFGWNTRFIIFYNAVSVGIGEKDDN